eukprot:scaffold25431_cov55-Attheya_sp.AAC.3
MRRTTIPFFKTFIRLSSLCHLVGGFCVIHGIDAKNSRPPSLTNHRMDTMEWKGVTKFSLPMTPLPTKSDVDEMKRDIEVLKETTRNIEVLLGNTPKQDAINTKFDALNGNIDAKFASIDAKLDALNESIASVLHGSPADGPEPLLAQGAEILLWMAKIALFGPLVAKIILWYLCAIHDIFGAAPIVP